MKFTGTLIEDLMATVERAERMARPGEALIVAGTSAGATSVAGPAVDPMFIETSLLEPWLASGRENADYDPKFVGVA
jgi:hypothetical protein